MGCVESIDANLARDLVVGAPARVVGEELGRPASLEDERDPLKVARVVVCAETALVWRAVDS